MTRPTPNPTMTSGRERGTALFVVMIALVSAAALSAGMLAVAMARTAQMQRTHGMDMALAMAEAGLDRAVILANDNIDDTTTWPNSTTPWTSLDDEVVDEAGNVIGRFEVEFRRGDADGIDNDGDGDIDSADTDEDSWLTIWSDGYYPATDERFAATVQAMYTVFTGVPEIQGAVFVDTVGSVDFDLGSGTQWKISGKDHDMYSDAATGVTANDLPGLGLVSGASVAPSSDDPNSKVPAQIDGASGSEYQTGMTDNVDIDAIIEWAEEFFPDETRHYYTADKTNPPGLYGTAADDSPVTEPEFVLQYYEARDEGASTEALKQKSIKFASNTSGAGILVVNGDLDIAGTITWTGIVIVKGSVTFSGGGSDNMISGGLISSDSLDISVGTNGTIDVLYSNEAVTKATNASKRWNLRFWKREAAPEL